MLWINSVEKVISIGILVWLICACSTYQDLTQGAGLTDQIIPGTRHLHRIITNRPAQSEVANTHWHVYIEGDGRPVDTRGRPSADPTPRTPLLLPMMIADPMPALYLGRPCYYYTEDPNCSPFNWTLARYSETTVKSMAQALERVIPPTATITLIGHSGGGALAVLLANHLTNVNSVITLAGNLQVAKWTQHHHYSPLSESLDPATQPPLPACIKQYHFAGADDEEILPAWIEEYAQNRPSSHFQTLEGTDHRGDWPLWWTLVKLEPTIKAQRCDKITSNIKRK